MSLKQMADIAERLWEEYELNPKNQDAEGDTLYWVGESGFLDITKKAIEATARAFLEYARGKANRTTSAHEPFVKLSDLEDWCKEEGENEDRP